MSGALQAVLEAGVAAGDVPFVVGMVADAGGTRWAGSAGEAAPGREAGADTVFAVFSMTKAVGAVAAMILADRGRLDLDAPVEAIVPEFGEVRLLEGWDGEVPRLRRPARQATVRQLASHTSGLAYAMHCGEMLRYQRATGMPSPSSGELRGLGLPLVCEPGTRWQYGTGIDWLGRVVEAVDGRRIDAFVGEEILGPLGMASSGFEPTAAMQARMAQVFRREAGGGFEAIEYRPPSHPAFYGMGHAMYASPADYLRFLRTLLGGGALDGVRILSGDAVAALLANQIGGLRIGVMPSALPRQTADLDLFAGTPKTHSLAALRVEADVPGMRRAGAQGWAGILNTHYWIDPASGVAAVLMTQALPFVEPRFMRLYEAFERAVYAGRQP